MLGYLLYEAVEVTYTVSKLLYTGVSSTYYWYYGVENLTEKKLEYKEDEKDKIIAELKDRMDKLEKKLEN
jgi:hypothetical protein